MTPAAEVREARRRRLEGAAAQLQLELSNDDSSRLLDFLDLLQRWNATYNLTAVRDPAEMLVQHLFDCLAIVPSVRKLRGDPQRLLDVGSGGGLPGVVLAILCPGLQVTCVDAVGKKAAFVRQVGVELGLRNLRVEHSRVEALVGEPFGIITSRAFASLAEFVKLTRPQLAAGGTWLAMKGRLPTEEMDSLPHEVEVFHVEPLKVPDLDADRCLVCMRVLTPPAGD